MKKTIKKITVGIIAASFVFSLGGCGSGKTPSESGPNATEEQVKGEVKEPSGGIKVWVTSGAEDDVYRESFEMMREELGIEIKDEYYPRDELDNKLQVAPVVGDAPDMIIVDYLNMPAYYEAGMIANLDGYMDSSLKSDLLDSIVDESTYNNELISTAQFDAGMALWGNKSMLDAAGIRIPIDYTDAWDRDEFEDALVKLKDSGVEYPIYIRQNKPSSLYFTYLPILASFGGDYVNRDTMLTKGVLDGEETIKAFSYMAWLGNEGYMNAACDYEDAFYGRKESALALLGHWKYTDHVTNLGDDAILLPIPDFGNGTFTCSGSTVWGMTTAAVEDGKADLVWSVLEKSLEPDYIKLVTDFNGAIPSRVSVLDSNKEMQPGGRLYLYRQQLEAGISVLRPLTPAHMTIYSTMDNAISDIIGGADPTEVLEEAASYIDDIIIENSWDK